MAHIRSILAFFILLVNLLTASAFLLSAYSPYISPEKYPMLSCAGLVFPVLALSNICFIFFWLLFHYKFCLVSLVALLLSIPQIRTYFPMNLHSKDVPSTRIKLLSYNVMSFNNMEKVKGENPILR